MSKHESRLEEDYDTAKGRPRPIYQNKMEMFSPEQVNYRHKKEQQSVDVSLKPLIKNTDASYLRVPPRSKSSIGGSIYRHDQTESHRQSALANFVDERRSSKGLLDPRYEQDHHRRSSKGIRAYEPSMHQESSQPVASRNLNHSSANNLQSRSSSAIIAGRSTSTPHQGNVVHTSSTALRAFESKQSYNLAHQPSYVETTDNSTKHTLPDHYEKTDGRYNKKDRSLKDCKQELKQDRQAKAQRRKTKEHKHKSRRTKHPEVVVVYRYPQQSTSYNTSSAEATQSSQYMNTSNVELQSTRLQNGYALAHDNSDVQESYRITPFIGGGDRKKMGSKCQILSVTSGGFNNESSMPISPTDLFIQPPLAKPHRSREGRKRSRESKNRDIMILESKNQNSSTQQSNLKKKKSRHSNKRNSTQKTQSSWSIERRRERKGERTHSSQRHMNQDASEHFDQANYQAGGIPPYQPPSSSGDLSSSQRPPKPMTSSQLADDSLYLEKKSQNSKKNKNEAFLYYQRLQQHANSVALSHRPQEVVLAEQQRQSNHKNTRESQASQLAQHQSCQSSKLNLADYKSLMSQQEAAYAEKMLNRQSLEQQAAHQNEEQQQNHWSYKELQERADQNNHRRSVSSSADTYGHRSSSALRQRRRQSIHEAEEESPWKPRSKAGQAYLEYLERNKRAQSINGQRTLAVRQSLLDENPKPEPKLLAMSMKKTVASAKQYCINKMLGRLNTKRELEKVSLYGHYQREAQSQVQDRYQQAASSIGLDTQPTIDCQQLPHDGSKASFIQRFERHHKRQVSKNQMKMEEDVQNQYKMSEQRSHSVIDLQAAQDRFMESRVELLDSQIHQDNHQAQGSTTRQYNDNHGYRRQSSSDQISSYYTLGAAEKQKQWNIAQLNYANQEQHQQVRKSSPLRNSSKEQADYNAKMLHASDMHELMSRADHVIEQSTHQLQQASKAGTIDSQPHQVEDASRHISSYNAGNHYDHRINELQRQTNEFQRLPEFYNERVASLKQRTQELNEIAKNYSSQEKDRLRLSNGHSGHKLELNQADQPRMYEHQPSPMKDDSSFVKQHDITSSFLQEEQQKHRGSSNQTKNRRQHNHAQLGLQQHQTEEYYDHVNSATKNQEHEKQRIYNDQMIAALEQPQIHHMQVYSQQITTLGQNDGRHDEFELTKKMNKLAFSQGDTYRQQASQPYTQTTLTAEKQDNHYAEEQEKRSRRQKRREQRDRKLQKLKELHDQAQSSMTKIASELTSQKHSARHQLSSFHNHPQIMSQSNMQSDYHESAMQSPDKVGGLDGTHTIFDDKRESVKSQVEKLANTRREIKKLIKIQNQHSKLLKKLQQKGVIKESESNAMLQNDESQVSVSDLSVNQKNQMNYQVAMSTTLLSQMQEIFKYLQVIQQKLDFEVEERKKRTGQIRDDKMTHLEEAAEILRRGSEQYPSIQHASRISANHQQHLSEQTAQLGQLNQHNNMSQGTHSTLFWDTQMAKDHQINTSATVGVSPYQNDMNCQQNFQMHKVGTNYSHGSVSQEMTDIRTTQSDQEIKVEVDPNCVQQSQKLPFVNKYDKMPFSQPNGNQDGTQVTESDEAGNNENENELGPGKNESTICVSDQANNLLHNARAQNSSNTFNTAVMSATGGSMNLQGIKVDQLCEILSREITRVREESVEQAQAMHMQYEMELEALRNEFFVKQDAQQRQMELITGQTTEDDRQMHETTDQMHYYQDNSHYNVVASENLTNRQRIESSRNDLQAQQNDQDQFQMTKSGANQQMQSSIQAQEVDMRQTNVAAEQMNHESQSVFEELEKVKAERDSYYNKLMKVRNRIEMGKDQRKNALEHSIEGLSNSFHLVQQEICQQQETISDTQNMSHNLIHDQNEGDQSEFLHPDAQRNVRSVNQIVKTPGTPLDQQSYPSLEAKSNTELCSFQHDFVAMNGRPNGANAIQTRVQKHQNFVPRPHTSTSHNTNEQRQTAPKQAGKIVHQFRSYQDHNQNAVPANPARNGSVMNKSSQYVNVRHNRTSQLRQNRSKEAKDNAARKSSRCQEQNADAGLGGSQEQRSFASGRSHTSKTRKNVKTNPALNTHGGGRDSSNEHAPQPQTAPFIYCQKDQSIVSSASIRQNAATAQINRITSNETFSNKGLNSTGQSHYIGGALGHEPPSQKIGGQSIQTMMARSPHLINRLAAEHEQYMSNMQAMDSFENTQMQQTGGPISEYPSDADQNRTSKALSVISHYLEKYDRPHGQSAYDQH